MNSTPDYPNREFAETVSDTHNANRDMLVDEDRHPNVLSPSAVVQSDTVRVAVWFTITRDEYAEGWERLADDRMDRDEPTLHPAEELAESVIARLDEFYGDDGMPYQPTIQNVNVSVDGSTFAYNPNERHDR